MRLRVQKGKKGRIGGVEHLFKFPEDPLCRKIIQVDRPHQPYRFLLHPKSKSRCKLHRPQHSQTVFTKLHRIDNPDDSVADVSQTSPMIDHLTRKDVDHQRIHRKITPSGGLFFVISERNFKSSVAGPYFSLQSGQCDIDLFPFIDKKTLSYPFGTDSLHQSGKLHFVYIVDFDIKIFDLSFQKEIPDTPSYQIGSGGIGVQNLLQFFKVSALLGGESLFDYSSDDESLSSISPR